MWAFFGKLLSGSKTLNALLGEVVFITPPEQGASNHSFFMWRVKQSADKSRTYIGVEMKADGYVGAEGSPTNYIQFDLDAAIRLRDNLNDCIDFVRQQSGAVTPQGG
jgi:hypothetical protein